MTSEERAALDLYEQRERAAKEELEAIQQRVEARKRDRDKELSEQSEQTNRPSQSNTGIETVVVPKPQTETKSSAIRPFKIKNGFELASTAPPKIPSLVDGLLIQVGTSLVSADPKCGKSSFARQLMVDIAEDRDFWGFPTLSGDSVYLYLEGPIGVVQQHFQKLGLTNQRGKIHVIDERMPNNRVFGLQRLAETVKDMHNLKLVIVDPLPKLLRLSNSDSSDDVTPAMELLEKFAKEHGIHVMALVHEKKRKGENRHENSVGSHAFRGASDTNISITKQGQERIFSTEQRWGIEMEPTLLKFDQEHLTSSLGSTVEAKEEEKRKGKERKTKERIEGKIMDALLKDKPTTQELVKAVTGKAETILEVLEQMVNAGKIKAEQDGRATRYSSVGIPDEERAA